MLNFIRMDDYYKDSEYLHLNHAWFKTNKDIKPIDDKNLFEKEVEDCILFVKQYTEDLIYYGAKSLIHQMGHGPGYVWSSRTGVVNHEFGTDYVDIVVNSCSFAISAKKLEKLLPDDLEIAHFTQEEGEEIYYVRKKR